jgi:hypothetical protein
MTDAIELLRHDHDEVRALLSQLEASPDPGRADTHDQAVSQEVELKRVLNLLNGLDPASPRFEPLVRRLTETGRAHHDFEEHRVWPGVRLALSEQELTELGARLEQGRRLAPTRPHPNLSPAPEVLRLAGSGSGRPTGVVTPRRGSPANYGSDRHPRRPDSLRRVHHHAAG